MAGVPKPIINESIDAISELVSKGYNPSYKLDLSDLESPEQAFNRIYKTPSEKPQKAPDKKTTNKPPQEATPQNSSLRGTACVTCSINHLSACAGLLSDEAIRFARREGVTSEEVIRRISRCQDQLNAMEREDLAVEKVAQLPDWEKKLAIEAQNKSAEIRHKLENISSIEDLENVALEIKTVRDELGKKWFKTLVQKKTKCEECDILESLRDYKSSRQSPFLQDWDKSA